MYATVGEMRRECVNSTAKSAVYATPPDEFLHHRFRLQKLTGPPQHRRQRYRFPNLAAEIN